MGSQYQQYERERRGSDSQMVLIRGGFEQKKKKFVSPHEPARVAVLQQKAIDEKAAARAFDSVDVEKSGWVSDQQIRELLQELLLVRKDISEKGLYVVMNAAHRAATVNGKMMDERGRLGMLPRVEVLQAANKYRYYVDRSQAIDGVYSNFDVVGAGSVTKKQIKQALDAVKMKTPQLRKASFGLIAELHAGIFNDDLFWDNLDFVLQDSFLNDDGTIDRSEMLPALATWEMLAQKHFEQHGVDACCSLQ